MNRGRLWNAGAWGRKHTPLLALLLLGLLAGGRLLSARWVSGGYDVTHHIWRAVSAEQLLLAGRLWPRWSPLLARGYGYPLFVFQGSLSAQLVAVLHLIGFPWVVSLNGIYLLGLLASGVTCYWAARELWGRAGGWGAAVLYLFAPYHLYVVYYRASLSETVAWLFAPPVLWGMMRWDRGERRGLWLGVASLVGLTMAHPVSLYLFAPLFVLAALGTRHVGRSFALLALGGAAGSFVWVPGLLERAHVQLFRATMGWVFRYEFNFLPLEQVLSLPRRADPRLLNDWPARGVGVWLLLGAVGGLATWRTRSRAERRWLLLLAAAGGGFLWLATETSRPLWDAVPLLAAFQFPWRFQAPAVLALAMVSGAGLAWLNEHSRHGWAMFLAVAAAVIGVYGWLYPPQATLPAPLTPAGALNWERRFDIIGTTAGGELLPVGVKELPPWDDSVPQAVLHGQSPRRFDEQVLPSGSRIVSEQEDLLGGQVELVATAPFTARWRVFAFPCWQVQVDGQPVAVVTESQTGVLRFSVPAGRHTIAVRCGEAPAWRWADVLSLLAAGLTLLWGLKLPRSGNPPRTSEHGSAWPWLVTSLLLIVFKLAGDVSGWGWWRQTRLRADGSLAGLAPQADFGQQARLLGVEPFPHSFPADDHPALVLYWQARDPTPGEWRVGLDLLAPDGSHQAIGLRPDRWGKGTPPLSEWPRDHYAREAYLLDVPPGTPPGTYEARVRLFERRTLIPASVLGADGNPLAPDLSLGKIELLPPRRVPSLAALEVPEGHEMMTCGPLGLWLMQADRQQAAPGELVALRWVWEARVKPSTDLTATVQLLDEAGQVLHTWALPPVAPWWPTSHWQAGQRWVGKPQIRLPGDLSSGLDSLRLSLGDCVSSVPLQVVAPERLWHVPDDFTPQETQFGTVLRLAGTKITPEQLAPGETLHVALAWQATAEMSTSYRVFLHLVRADGHIVGQSDGEPAHWTRPTTGWAVGEVVVDEREIPVPADTPPGRYTLRVGWYELNGPRLPTAAGDSLPIGEIEVR